MPYGRPSPTTPRALALGQRLRFPDVTIRTFVSPSIKLRLPLLIIVLLAMMVAGLGWSAHRELTLVSERAANERLGASSTGLTETLEQSITPVKAEVRRAAADPVVVDAFAHREASPA